MRGAAREEERLLLHRGGRLHDVHDAGCRARATIFYAVEATDTPNVEQEIKIRACRVILQGILVASFFLVYYLTFGLCDYCILAAAAGSCVGTCAGMTFLGPSCWAGVLACLLRGFRLGNEIASVDIHWKIR